LSRRRGSGADRPSGGLCFPFSSFVHGDGRVPALVDCSTTAGGELVTNMYLAEAGRKSGRASNVFRRKTNAPSVIAFTVNELTRKVFVFMAITFYPGAGMDACL
jgi:hypothetical protein